MPEVFCGLNMPYIKNNSNGMKRKGQETGNLSCIDIGSGNDVIASSQMLLEHLRTTLQEEATTLLPAAGEC